MALIGLQALVPIPAAAATRAEGSRRCRRSRDDAPVADGLDLRARGLNPAPFEPGGEPKRSRTEGDVEHGCERRTPDRQVGTVEDGDHYQPDRPAPGEACGGEAKQ